MVDPVGIRANSLVKHLSREDGNKRLEEACKCFEAIFLARMLKTSRKDSVSWGGEDSPFKALEETSMEMAAESLSKQGGIGLWKVLYDSLQDLDEQEGMPDGWKNGE
jgi:Rod binding domain-containing protein